MKILFGSPSKSGGDCTCGNCKLCFPGFKNINIKYKYLVLADWDWPCYIGGGKETDGDWFSVDGDTYSTSEKVDGHIVYECVSKTEAKAVSGSGNYCDKIGEIINPESFITDIIGDILSNTKANSNIKNAGCNNANGDKLFLALGNAYLDDGICSACPGPTSGANVFEISKQQYDNYLGGGTWNISVSISGGESTSTGLTSQSNPSSANFSTISSGCEFSYYGSYPHSVRYYNNGELYMDQNYNETCFINYKLGRANMDKYYIYLCGGAVGWARCDLNNNSGYGTSNATIDGFSVQTSSSWYPSWAGLPGYTEHSVVNLNATFIPN